MADHNTVVAADMVDLHDDGECYRDTNTVRRVKALGYEQVPAFVKAGLFGSCGGKLIPSGLLVGHRFDPELTSGEDVAFFSVIVAQSHVNLVASYRAPD